MNPKAPIVLTDPECIAQIRRIAAHFHGTGLRLSLTRVLNTVVRCALDQNQKAIDEWSEDVLATSVAMSLPFREPIKLAPKRRRKAAT